MENHWIIGIFWAIKSGHWKTIQIRTRGFIFNWVPALKRIQFRTPFTLPPVLVPDEWSAYNISLIKWTHHWFEYLNRVIIFQKCTYHFVFDKHSETSYPEHSKTKIFLLALIFTMSSCALLDRLWRWAVTFTSFPQLWYFPYSHKPVSSLRPPSYPHISPYLHVNTLYLFLGPSASAPFPYPTSTEFDILLSPRCCWCFYETDLMYSCWKRTCCYLSFVKTSK